MLDCIERRFIQKKNWRINELDQIVLTRRQFDDYQYSGTRLTDARRTIMIPSIYGSTLLTEGTHFIIEGGNKA